MRMTGAIIEIASPDHTFRYPSEWDPRDNPDKKTVNIESEMLLGVNLVIA